MTIFLLYIGRSDCNFQIKSLSRREHLINMESNVVVFKNDYNKRH